MKKRIKLFLTIILLSILFTSTVNAANAYINLVPNKRTVMIGDTFNVTFTVTSSTPIGGFDCTLNYDTNKFKLISGYSKIVGWTQEGTTTKMTASRTFKAIGTGKGIVSLKNCEYHDFDEKYYTPTISPTYVTVNSKSNVVKTYSSNNNLSSLSIEGYSITPEFNKNTTEYNLSLPSDVEGVVIKATKEDSNASVNGDGSKVLTEGINIFEIIVTAENGSSKKYKINITVQDDNPIKVVVNKKNYTIVKRISSITIPEGYELQKIKIDDIDVPSFYNKNNKIRLIALKDDNGNVSLFIYNRKNDTYLKYEEIGFDVIKLLPLKMDKELDGYTKDSIKINNSVCEILKLNDSDFAIIKAKDLETGKDDYYLYDSKLNTVIRYTDKLTLNLHTKIKKYQQIILILISETVIVFVILLYMLLKKRNIINLKKRYIIKNTLDDDKKEEKENDKQKEEKNIKNKKEKEKKKNAGDKNEEKKNN